MSAREELLEHMNDEYDWLEYEHDASGQCVPGEFRITDANGAAWAIRKIRAARSRQHEAAKAAATEIDKIMAWRDRINDESVSTVERMEGYLHDYMMQKQAENPKLKTVDVPGAKLQTRTTAAYGYDDEAMEAWARENLPEAIVVTERLSHSTVKKHFAETGENVPGLTVQTKTSFYVKLQEEE